MERPIAMFCHKCDQRAAVRMRQHRLILCKDHFLEWFVDQTLRFIAKYDMFSHQEKVLVAVSGGKDSLSLWDVLWRSGYQADGLYINLGIEGEDHYSDQSELYARKFADERGLALKVVNVHRSFGRTVPELNDLTRRGRSKPCSVCGMVKRHIMNDVAHKMGYSTLATAHNLDDEAAILYNNVMNWQVDLLQRQALVLQAGSGFVRKVKPFCRFYERETAAYAVLRGIPYIEDECPFAEGSTQLHNKEILNRLEIEHPGTKLRFYAGFVKARQDGFLGKPIHDEEPGELHACPQCGQPTSSNEKCAFCRMVGPTKT